MTKKKNGLLPLLLAVCLLLTGCTAGQTGDSPPSAGAAILPTASAAELPDPTKKTTGVGFYFDTVVSLTLYGAPEGIIDEVWAACARYENLLSKTIETSDVSRINAANGETVTVDPETWQILRRAKEISALTDGAFSITIAPLTALWSFTDTVSNLVPTDEARTSLLPLVDDQKIILGENNTVTLPAGMEIDLGGVAKGYIADKVAELLRGRTTAAIISLGGNVYTTGQKPDGSPFGVGIKDPHNPAASRAAIYTGDGTVVTSGTYERGFSFGGVRFHHILDPKTGWPSQSDLVSATFVMDSSMTADALATACIVIGSERSLALAKELGLDAMLIKADGTALFTEGFEEKYNYKAY
ncbi:MAG: FAD:protein FMN transferase [Clostridia bacterium]|nr:FAD:protein FMN transferase [Clostridia bacterium]